ncbi:MAG: phosphate signaling complex protein PhoU, partial [Thermoplasmata archaeon]|nr:phosphate signaling complex protein PhoU [Thermoplasmata archaeon]
GVYFAAKGLFVEVRKSFHQQLEELYLDLLRMSNVTVEILERTRAAFQNLDSELADNIIASDDELDDFVVRIEENGIELLARQAPVAIDLRTIIVIMRLAQHLERVADLCVNICKAIKNLQGYTLSPWIKENMDEMFKRSSKMLVSAIESFKQHDVELAEELSTMDDTVDKINRTFLTSYDRESEEELELTIRVVMIARFLERVADHAVDIGESVRYMVTGQFVE